MFPIAGRITQPFGRSALRTEPTMWLAPDNSRCRPTKFPGAELLADVHPGVDIACKVGTPIHAPGDGVVLLNETYRTYNVFTKRMVYGHATYFRYGNRIMYVDHIGDPDNARGPFAVKAGTVVKAGGLVGHTGNSGNSSGPHAHAEDRIATDAHDSWAAFRRNPQLSWR